MPATPVRRRPPVLQGAKEAGGPSLVPKQPNSGHCYRQAQNDLISWWTGFKKPPSPTAPALLSAVSVSGLAPAVRISAMAAAEPQRPGSVESRAYSQAGGLALRETKHVS